MRLSYLPLDFTICFDIPAFVDTNPLFVLRSVLGKNLRSMCCVSRQSKCPDCLFRNTCVYVFLFETILPQENRVVPGRNRASHPYSLRRSRRPQGKTLSDYGFTIVLFGKAAEYLPYIYSAFVQAGRQGLFKGRHPFFVKDVQVAGRSILLDDSPDGAGLQVLVPPFEWQYLEEGENRRGEVLVELVSPFRFKMAGRYGGDFTAADFIGNIFRRAKTICQLYGSFSEDSLPDGMELRIVEKNLRWQEACHYSGRQKTEMALGGLQGSFILTGDLMPQVVSLLEFGRLCNIGKNTNFGLGQMDYWIK